MGFAPQNYSCPNKNGRFAPGFADLSKFGGVLQPSSNRFCERVSEKQSLLLFFRARSQNISDNSSKMAEGSERRLACMALCIPTEKTFAYCQQNLLIRFRYMFPNFIDTLRILGYLSIIRVGDVPLTTILHT